MRQVRQAVWWLLILGSPPNSLGWDSSGGQGPSRQSLTYLLAGTGIEGWGLTGRLGGWDTRSDNFEGTPGQAAVLDQAMSTLL